MCYFIVAFPILYLKSKAFPELIWVWFVMNVWACSAFFIQAHITQDSAQETAEKIKELEKALQESMNTSTHREALWVQEEQAHALAQTQVHTHVAVMFSRAVFRKTKALGDGQHTLSKKMF